MIRKAEEKDAPRVLELLKEIANCIMQGDPTFFREKTRSMTYPHCFGSFKIRRRAFLFPWMKMMLSMAM